MIHLIARRVFFLRVKTRHTAPTKKFSFRQPLLLNLKPSPTPTALFQVSPSDLYEALTAAAAAPDSDGKLVEMSGAANVVAVVFEKERLGEVVGGGLVEGAGWQGRSERINWCRG